jgi:hypothetical protein
MTKTITESLFPCAVTLSREQADRFAARLVAAGIEAVVTSAGPRYHGLVASACEVFVPATQAARARALLSA